MCFYHQCRYGNACCDPFRIYRCDGNGAVLLSGHVSFVSCSDKGIRVIEVSYNSIDLRRKTNKVRLTTLTLGSILCFEMTQNTRLQQRAPEPLALLDLFLSNNRIIHIDFQSQQSAIKRLSQWCWR